MCVPAPPGVFLPVFELLPANERERERVFLPVFERLWRARAPRFQIYEAPAPPRPVRALLAGLPQQSMSLRGRVSVAPCSDSLDGVLVDVAAR